MKIWLSTVLLVLSAAAWGAPPSADGLHTATPDSEAHSGDAPDIDDTTEPPINWVDTTHSYATNQAQSLAEWMDGFFGDPNYDIESAESLLRLDFSNEWDEKDSWESRIRLRGKLQLPRISRRLNLVFSGEDGDQLNEEELQQEDRVALQYNVAERNQSRLDLSLGLNLKRFRPGIRFRNQGPVTEKSSYRFTQRLQWEDDEGFYTTGEVELNRVLDEDKLLRWGNRLVYGEETEGTEWRSGLSLRQRLRDPAKKKQFVVNYFTSVNGVTDPHSYTKNYRLGVQFRRQVYRKYLYLELEPSYNWRKRHVDDDRDGVWNIVMRLEIALQRDLRHVDAQESESQEASAAAAAEAP